MFEEDFKSLNIEAIPLISRSKREKKNAPLTFANHFIRNTRIPAHSCNDLISQSYGGSTKHKIMRKKLCKEVSVAHEGLNVSFARLAQIFFFF